MKTPIKQVLLQTSLFIVQFSKRCLKISSWTFIKNQPKTDAFEAFVKSLSRVPSTSSLSTATWQMSLQQDFCLTLLMWSIGRHFRLKLVHWNKSVYCTPIDRTLKMRFNEGSGSFLRPTIPELWSYEPFAVFWTK